MLPILLMIAALSAEDVRKEFGVSAEDATIALDAIRRWAAKNSGTVAPMSGRDLFIERSAQQRCVTLELRVPIPGGNPVYCYKKNEDVLLEANDDVE